MKNILCTAFLALLIATSAYASPGGDISGIVKGEDGAPFRAAFVRAQNVKTKMLMMVLTDNQGQYRTDNLAAGTYEVWATSTGYRSDPSRRTDVTVQEGKTTSAGFTMKKGRGAVEPIDQVSSGNFVAGGQGKRRGPAGMFQLPRDEQNRRDGARSRRLARSDRPYAAGRSRRYKARRCYPSVRVLEHSFWPRCQYARIASSIAAISKGQAGTRLLCRRRSESRLRRLSIDRRAEGSSRDRETGQGWKHLDGNGRRIIQARSRDRRAAYVEIAGHHAPVHS